MVNRVLLTQHNYLDNGKQSQSSLSPVDNGQNTDSFQSQLLGFMAYLFILACFALLFHHLWKALIHVIRYFSRNRAVSHHHHAMVYAKPRHEYNSEYEDNDPYRYCGLPSPPPESNYYDSTIMHNK